MNRRPDPATRRQHAATVRSGVVLRLYQPIAQKTKRHLLIAADADRSISFLINSDPSAFIQRRPELATRQVLMARATHPFMEHDSYIACYDAVRLVPFDGLVDELCQGAIERLGFVDQSLHSEICAAAAGSTMISAHDAALILKAFPPMLAKS